MTNSIPGLGAATFAAKIPLYDWYRKADLSADRAACLVMGDSQPVLRMIGKIAGGSGQLAEQISVASLLEQARETRQMIAEMQRGGLKQKAAYFFSNLITQGMFRTQPWPAIRVLEIQEWAESQSAKDLLDGKLPAEEAAPRADEEQRSSFLKDWSDVVTDVGKSLKFWGAEEDPSSAEEENTGREGR